MRSDDAQLATLQRRHLMASVVHWSLSKAAAGPLPLEHVENLASSNDDYLDAIDELPPLLDEQEFLEPDLDDNLEDASFGLVGLDGNEILYASATAIRERPCPPFDGIQPDRNRMATKRAADQTHVTVGQTVQTEGQTVQNPANSASRNRAQTVDSPPEAVNLTQSSGLRDWHVPSNYGDACEYIITSTHRRRQSYGTPVGVIQVLEVSPEVRAPQGLQFLDFYTIRQRVSQQPISCHAGDKMDTSALGHFQMAIAEMVIHQSPTWRQGCRPPEKVRADGKSSTLARAW